LVIEFFFCGTTAGHCECAALNPDHPATSEAGLSAVILLDRSAIN
jgi:hypothetical protein